MAEPLLYSMTAWLEYLENQADNDYLGGARSVGYKPVFTGSIIGTTNDGLKEAFDDMTTDRSSWLYEHPSAIVCLPWKKEDWEDGDPKSVGDRVLIMHTMEPWGTATVFGIRGFGGTLSRVVQVEREQFNCALNCGQLPDKSAFGKSFVPNAKDFWNCELTPEALLNLTSSTKKGDTGSDCISVKNFKKQGSAVSFKPSEMMSVMEKLPGPDQHGRHASAVALLVAELKRGKEVAQEGGLVSPDEAKKMWWRKWATLWIIAKAGGEDGPDLEVESGSIRSTVMLEEYERRAELFKDFCIAKDLENASTKEDDTQGGGRTDKTMDADGVDPPEKDPTTQRKSRTRGGGKGGDETVDSLSDTEPSERAEKTPKTKGPKDRNDKSRSAASRDKPPAERTVREMDEDQSRTVTPEGAGDKPDNKQVRTKGDSSKSTLRSLARKRGQPDDDSSSSSSSSSSVDTSDSDESSVDLTALTGPQKALMKLKEKKLRIARKNLKEKKRTRRHHKKQRQHSKKLFEAQEDQAAEMQWMREAQADEAQKKSDRKSTTHKWTDEQVRLLNLASSKQFVERRLPELTPEAQRMFKSSGTISSMIEGIRKESRKWKCNVIDSCLAHIFSFGLHNADITVSLAGFSTSMFVPKRVDQIDFTRKEQVRRLFQENLGDGDLPAETINDLAELKVYFVKWCDLDDAIKIMECCVSLLTFILGDHNIGANIYRKGLAWAQDNYNSMTSAINNDKDKTFLLKYLYLLDRHFHNFLKLLSESGGAEVDPMSLPQTRLTNYAENSFNAELGAFVTGAGGAVGNLTLPSRLGVALYNREPAQEKEIKSYAKKATEPKTTAKEKGEVKAKKVDEWARSKEAVPPKWKLPGGKKFADVFGKMAPDQNKSGFPKLKHHTSGGENAACLRFHSIGRCDFGKDCRMTHSTFSTLSPEDRKTFDDRFGAIYSSL